MRSVRQLIDLLIGRHTVSRTGTARFSRMRIPAALFRTWPGALLSVNMRDLSALG